MTHETKTLSALSDEELRQLFLSVDLVTDWIVNSDCELDDFHSAVEQEIVRRFCNLPDIDALHYII